MMKADPRPAPEQPTVYAKTSGRLQINGNGAMAALAPIAFTAVHAAPSARSGSALAWRRRCGGPQVRVRVRVREPVAAAAEGDQVVDLVGASLGAGVSVVDLEEACRSAARRPAAVAVAGQDLLA
jgi:hypothetical protein